MARKFRESGASGRAILLVDDNLEYLEATRLVLEREGHAVVVAETGEEALRVARECPVDLMLLDYYMPGMNGDEVLAELRKFQPRMQVILQTGYASENPPRELVKKLDIQGYFDKSEGPEKLLLWTDVGLKAAQSASILEKSRVGVSYVLAETPDICRIQPLESLLSAILSRFVGLLETLKLRSGADEPDAEPDPAVDGFLAMPGEDGSSLTIRAMTGRYVAVPELAETALRDNASRFHDALSRGSLDGSDLDTVIPLRVANQTVGIAYLARPLADRTERELSRVFANQAAVAIQNGQLYEMATIDPLTGAFVRRFFNQCLLRALKGSSRTLKPVGLIMIDMDNMKPINDRAGHLAGDRALVDLANVLRESTRSSDFIGRFGGDEFSILLPDSSEDGVSMVAERIFEGLSRRNAPGSGGGMPITVSLGIAILEPPEGEIDQARPVFWQSLADYLLNQSDLSLYEAKRGGKGCAGRVRRLAWPDPGLLDLVATTADYFSGE
jgi:diguanylate cyclase (GGDEF)-like protein